MSQKIECPKCLGMLEPKEVGELKGTPVFIDQCPVCQGIWFDTGELWKVLKGKIAFDQEEAEKDFRPDFTGDVFDLKEAHVRNVIRRWSESKVYKTVACKPITAWNAAEPGLTAVKCGF